MKKTKKIQTKSSRDSSKKSKKFLDNPIVSWGIIIIALVFILFAVFSKITGNVVTGNASANSTTITDFFSFASKWNVTNLDLNIAKAIFLLLVTGVVWAALSFSDFPPQKILQGLIAVAIGFLAVIYITPAEVLTILQSYTALGITLAFILPFIILVFISAQLLAIDTKGTASVGKILVEIFLWAFYIVVLFYKMIMYIVNKGGLQAGTETGLDFTLLILLTVFIISALILIFNNKFRKFVNRLERDLQKARLKAIAAKTVEGVKMSQQIDEAQSPASQRKARREARS